MDHIQITTSQNVDIDFEMAGIGDRVIAALIDYVILFSYLFFIVLVTSLVKSRSLLMLGLLPYLTYFLLCEVFMNGQSIGKKMRRLKVVRLGGGQPTLGSFLLRWLLRFVDIDFTYGLVGLGTMLINGKGQRLGDLAAGTTAVRVKSRIHLNDTIFSRTDKAYQPVHSGIERLSHGDIETAREVLNTLVRERRTHITMMLGKKMKAALEDKMGTSSEQPPLEFLRSIIKDYNHVKGRV